MKNRSPESISALGLMTAAGISLLPSGPAHALVITTNCQDATFCTPFELQYGGDFVGAGSIQVDDKLFSNWSFDPTPSDPGILDFAVSATGEGTNAPGLLFSGDIADGDNTSLTIRYTVSLMDDGRDDFGSWRIVDSELDLIDYTIDTLSTGTFYGESIVITETSAAFNSDLEVRVEDLLADPPGPEVQMKSDSNTFSPVTSLSVITTIQLFDGSFDPVAELTGFEQRFSQAQVDVPEPPSVALFGVGLAALGGGKWLRRRRKGKE